MHCYYDEGYNAFWDDIAKCDCPYGLENVPAMMDWYAGWDFAQIEDCG
jgi:hypothetical protein